MNRVDGDPWGAKDGYICVQAHNTSYFNRMHKELTRDLKDEPMLNVEQIAWAPPIMLYQSKIICTDEFWLPAWNFIVRNMRQDVYRLCWDELEASSGNTAVDWWNEARREIEVIKKELDFWSSPNLWTPHFSPDTAREGLKATSAHFSEKTDTLIDMLQYELTDDTIPRCLFIRNMHVADELLRSIFRKNFAKEPDHVVCMILSHLYLLENPFTCLFHVIPAEKRAQFCPNEHRGVG